MKVNIKQAIDYVVVNTPDKTQISSNIEKVKKLFAKTKSNVSGLEWLEGESRDKYIHDMKIAQDWAKDNRGRICFNLIVRMRWNCNGIIESLHNYLGDDGIIRKSAICANEAQR